MYYLEVNHYNLTIAQLLYGSNATYFSTTVSQRSPEDKRSSKDFDERIILPTNRCSAIMLIVYPQSLTNSDILGQGNLNLVREKSGNFTFYNLWEP